MSALDEDVRKQLKEVENMLVKIDDLFGNLEQVDYEETCKTMTPVERARYDITIAYAINSLFWMYLRSMGEDPKSHKVKEELDRIKSQMQRLQQVNDKAKRPRVDTEAAGRMIRHGIRNNNSRKRKTEEEENWENEQHEGEEEGGEVNQQTGASAACSSNSGGGGASAQKKQK